MTYTVQQLNESAKGVDWRQYKRTVHGDGRSNGHSSLVLAATTLPKTTGLDIRQAFEADAAGWRVMNEEGWTLEDCIENCTVDSHETWHVARHKDGAEPVAVNPETDLREVSTAALLAELALRAEGSS